MPRELFVYDHPDFEAVALRYRLAVSREDGAEAERCRRELKRLADENARREQSLDAAAPVLGRARERRLA